MKNLILTVIFSYLLGTEICNGDPSSKHKARVYFAVGSSFECPGEVCKEKKFGDLFQKGIESASGIGFGYKWKKHGFNFELMLNEGKTLKRSINSTYNVNRQQLLYVYELPLNQEKAIQSLQNLKVFILAGISKSLHSITITDGAITMFSEYETHNPYFGGEVRWQFHAHVGFTLRSAWSVEEIKFEELAFETVTAKQENLLGVHYGF
jgi:hypothetical protein